MLCIEMNGRVSRTILRSGKKEPMARMLRNAIQRRTTGVAAACIVVLTCAAGSRPRFAGYLPYTGTSSVRVLQDPREEGFFELPPLSSLDSSGEGLPTTDAADPSALTDPSTVKTNLIPERIEKTFLASSQMMTSTNSGPQAVILTNVVGGGVLSPNLLLDGFDWAIETKGDVLLPPSGQASLRDLLPYFSSPTNRPSATLPNGGGGNNPPSAQSMPQRPPATPSTTP